LRNNPHLSAAKRLKKKKNKKMVHKFEIENKSGEISQLPKEKTELNRILS